MKIHRNRTTKPMKKYLPRIGLIALTILVAVVLTAVFAIAHENGVIDGFFIFLFAVIVLFFGVLIVRLFQSL